MTQDNDSIVENAKRQMFNEKPDLSLRSIAYYFKRRIPILFDLPVFKSDYTVAQTLNPIPALKELDGRAWQFYLLGFFGWTLDAFDFFCVSVSASQIAVAFDRSIKDITWGITLVLMFRSLGALTLGYISDIYGRKWPFILILMAFSAIGVGTGFVKTYAQFLGARSIFGFFLGGFYPLCVTTLLEDAPTRARAILSGIFVPAWCWGYILAIIFFRAFEFSYKDGEGFRSLFWFSGGLPIPLIIWRFFLPETNAFQNIKEQRKILNKQKGNDKTWFDKTIIDTFKTEWLMFIYLVIMMAAFNFIAHGSQDLFPTMLDVQRQTTADERTVIMVIINLGAITGGLFFGQVSELVGRRLLIIICSTLSVTMIYPTFMVDHTPTIIGCGFFLNLFIIGSWGIAPILLLELVNNNHRSLLVGLVYQLGNLASSASTTIESAMGENYPLESNGELQIYDYGKVMAIFVGILTACLVVIILVGPERFHKDFGDGHENIDTLVRVGSSDVSSIEKDKVVPHAEHKEVV